MAVSTKDPRGARWEKSAQNQMQRAPYAPLLRELWQLAAIGTWQACPAPVTFWHSQSIILLPDRPVPPRWPSGRRCSTPQSIIYYLAGLTRPGDLLAAGAALPKVFLLLPPLHLLLQLPRQRLHLQVKQVNRRQENLISWIRSSVANSDPSGSLGSGSDQWFV